MLPFIIQSTFLKTLRVKDLENTVEKGENTGRSSQILIFFSQYFLFYQRQKSSFDQCLFYRVQEVKKTVSVSL